METIATYWEKQIRIYGITLRENLTLLRWRCPASVGWERLAEIGLHGCSRFEMAAAQPDIDNGIRGNLIVRHQDQEPALKALSALLADLPEATIFEPKPAGLVFLHGPHFQDRFGIAEAVSRALEPAEIPVLFRGYSGTSVYLAVPPALLEKTAEIVGRTFSVPGR